LFFTDDDSLKVVFGITDYLAPLLSVCLTALGNYGVREVREEKEEGENADDPRQCNLCAMISTNYEAL
jgi:hypothetical protein